MTGFLAYSKAGHDKGKVYVVIREEKEYVWLADGKIRTVSNPKKKRKKHIQLIKYFKAEQIREALSEGKEVSDLEIVMVLKEYKNKQRNDAGGN